MRMVIEVLSPGVQDSGEADVGAEVLWIGGDRREPVEDVPSTFAIGFEGSGDPAGIPSSGRWDRRPCRAGS